MSLNAHFFYLGSRYLLAQICTEILEVLGISNSNLDFWKYGYDFVSHPKNDWALPRNEGQVTVLILLGQSKHSTNVTV